MNLKKGLCLIILLKECIIVEVAQVSIHREHNVWYQNTCLTSYEGT